MANETQYSVRLRYLVDDKGRASVRGIVDDTKRLKHEARAAKSEFSMLGAAVVGAFGARAAGQALIGFNATVEDTKIQIAGMLALAKKTTIADQVKTADKLYANLQKRAATLPGETSEYVQMASKLTRVVTDAGGSVKELEDLTTNAVVAAKGLGEQWEVVARDIEQGLMGRYNTTDPFLSKLLPSIGYAGEEGRDKWRALSKDKRFEEMKRALLQPQITEAGEAYGKTFSGVLSTLKDNAARSLGSVGEMLFQQLKTEITGANKWMDENERKVESIARTLGEGLAKGFGVVKDALGFLVAHADTLLTLGKLWAAVKIGGMIGGGAAMARSAAGGAASGLGAWLAPQRDRFDPKTGGYEVIPAGAGRQRVTAGGALANAGLLAQAGLTGYALGNLLGLDKLGKDMGRQIGIWTGRIDENYLAWEKLQAATDKVTGAMERAAAAAERNAKLDSEKARAVTNVKGMSGLYSEAANLLGDRARAIATLDGLGGAMDIVRQGAAPNLDAQSDELVRRSAAKLGIGVDNLDNLTPQQVSAIMDDLKNTAGALKVKADTAAIQGQGFYNVGLTTLTDYQKRTLDTDKAMLEITQHLVAALSPGGAGVANYGTILEIMRRNTQDPTGKHQGVAEKPKVNVTIQRIEVQSDDPDRFAFGLVEFFRDAAKNPSSSIHALREG